MAPKHLLSSLTEGIPLPPRRRAGATPLAKEGYGLSADASPDKSRSKSERDDAAIYCKTPIRDAYDRAGAARRWYEQASKEHGSKRS
jgi:hypothetical protein